MARERAAMASAKPGGGTGGGCGPCARIKPTLGRCVVYAQRWPSGAATGSAADGAGGSGVGGGGSYQLRGARLRNHRRADKRRGHRTWNDRLQRDSARRGSLVAAVLREYGRGFSATE